MLSFAKIAVLGMILVGIDARPQLDDAARRALDGQDMFNPNPQYTFEYQVSNDDEQTYIAQQETRDGPQVTGEYSYVDPNGSLITVRYTANDVDGYSETRDVQEGFVTIRGTGSSVAVVPVAPRPVPRPVPAQPSQSDLVARIISQLTPFIRDTVTSTLSSQQRVVAQPIPVTSRVSSVEGRFGAGGASNIRVDTPEYNFATAF